MSKSDSRQKPNFDIERFELGNIGGPIAGVDEAGRGPWAGPVVAAAVVLDPDNLPDGLDDSKQLKESKREQLFDVIMNSADVGIGIATVERIDRDNILAATMWAMAEAVHGLEISPRLTLVDGNRAPQLNGLTRTIIKGDATSISISAASIIAKVTRDRMMVSMGTAHPGYGFEKHKGYGTKIHQDALAKLGVCEHHRKSFKPIKLALTTKRNGS
ncbi:MAG: ribonuclease HII [Hyphomicrobiaceae bacterium]